MRRSMAGIAGALMLVAGCGHADGPALPPVPSVTTVTVPAQQPAPPVASSSEEPAGLQESNAPEPAVPADFAGLPGAGTVTTWTVEDDLRDQAEISVAVGHAVAGDDPSAGSAGPCDHWLQVQAASNLRQSVAVPVMVTVTLRSAKSTDVSVGFLPDSIIPALYSVVTDPSLGTAECEALGASGVSLLKQNLSQDQSASAYYWTIFPAAISADSPDPARSGKVTAFPAPGLSFAGIGGAVHVDSVQGPGLVLCRKMARSYFMVEVRKNASNCGPAL